MAKYRTCPLCGAHLDHGERCDCREEQSREYQNPIDRIPERDQTGKSRTAA